MTTTLDDEMKPPRIDPYRRTDLAIEFGGAVRERFDQRGRELVRSRLDWCRRQIAALEAKARLTHRDESRLIELREKERALAAEAGA